MWAKKNRPESERYNQVVSKMGELSKLPNIGKAVEAQLIQGVKKTGLPDAVKEDLKAFCQEHKL